MIRTPGRGFGQRLILEEAEFDAIALDELRKAGCLPDVPNPVRIDRFIETRFALTIDYQDLGPSVLGSIVFDHQGSVRGIAISNSLAAESADRLFRSTLAHEAGHGLLHSALFIQNDAQQGLQFENAGLQEGRIMCRSNDVQAARQCRGYDGRWWEYQANRMIGSLLLPRTLVLQALDGLVDRTLVTQSATLPEDRRVRAATNIARIFEVNPIVASIRLDEVFPKDSGQAEF